VLKSIQSVVCEISKNHLPFSIIKCLVNYSLTAGKNLPVDAIIFESAHTISYN
jgi:hypothetical protein